MCLIQDIEINSHNNYHLLITAMVCLTHYSPSASPLLLTLSEVSQVAHPLATTTIRANERIRKTLLRHK